MVAAHIALHRLRAHKCALRPITTGCPLLRACIVTHPILPLMFLMGGGLPQPFSVDHERLKCSVPSTAENLAAMARLAQPPLQLAGAKKL